MPSSRILIIAVALLSGSAVPAHAQAFISPYLGYDIGGGLNIFLGKIGIRGDVRHLRTVQNVPLGLFSNDQLDFWRASAGITLRF